MTQDRQNDPQGVTETGSATYNLPRSAVITGGAGFIGTHLARHLKQAGCSVTTVDILPRSDDLDVVHEIWDLRRPLPLDLADAPDVILNLAAVHRTPGHPDREYYETNVAGAINVVNWAEAVGTPSICFTSSISVYGPGEDPKDESTLPAPVSPYGISKLMAEQFHIKWAEKSHERTLRIIRPAVVFGPKEHGNFTRLAHALEKGRFFYPGRDDTLKACGYVRDLVRAICFSLAGDGNIETYNYCYPHAYSIRDVCTAFHEIAGYPLPKTIPESLMALPLEAAHRLKAPPVSNFAERIRKLTVSTNVKPIALQNAGFTWETDLHGGIQEWHQACQFESFE